MCYFKVVNETEVDGLKFFDNKQLSFQVLASTIRPTVYKTWHKILFHIDFFWLIQFNPASLELYWAEVNPFQ